ncbi:DNA-binding transcriptional regulator OxyR [Psychrobium sp. 1_MG-2023]|uniref:DNA-binding transcriptional regulator OxyR n=1 Tax=Psychrobium sp. 1_MG-2023 TaxID=3062624 RepID=UPI000C32EBB6|nr:DNA-binding transcriptional regulator OxyR [Psychrobium sp. 1_MG-2023]MDP2559540.1 DNA-binding transcriptional regulator OxyR [Psychrobium sp. 1_MG-2023]PKF59379.1 DNA-binding transcriptional regulator OxyR [Alteromonadales bacterium alter-6D02]
MIKLRDLEYLDAIEQHKHFGQAAQACFVSQPTLSGQLMKLEDQLGLQLVERHRGNVMLTPAGETLVKEARQVLQAAQHFEASAKALLDPFAGDLHLGLIPTLAPYLLPKIMPLLSQSLPNIKFYLHEKQTKVLLEQLNQGKLDALILPYLPEMEKFDAYHLFDEPLMLACPKEHPLSDKKNLLLSDLHQQNILTLEDGHCLKDQAMGYCFAAGAQEDNSFQATSLETLRHMVACGLGITLLPALATQSGLTNENINYLAFENPQPTRGISLVVRPNYSRMICVRKLVALIRETVNFSEQIKPKAQ